MEEYMDIVRKMIKSMEETAWLLSKFQDIRKSSNEKEFYETLEKLDKEELEKLQYEFDRFEKIIRDNL